MYTFKQICRLPVFALLLFMVACADSTVTAVDTGEIPLPADSTATEIQINNRIGVNVPFRTHQRNLVESTNFESLDPLSEAVVELGVGFVRVSGIKLRGDGGPNTNLAFCVQLWRDYGIKTLPIPPNDIDSVDEFIAAIRKEPEMFVYVEGPNEHEPEDALAYMETLAQELEGTVSLAAPSLRRIEFYEPDLFTALPLDVANGHLYPNGAYPYNKSNKVLDDHIRMVSRSVRDGAPIVVTETGYHDTENPPSGQPAVMPEEAAAWLPLVLQDMLDRGVVLVSVHELQDDQSSGARQWGLLQAELDENGKLVQKPVFSALKTWLAQQGKR